MVKCHEEWGQEANAIFFSVRVRGSFVLTLSIISHNLQSHQCAGHFA